MSLGLTKPVECLFRDTMKVVVLKSAKSSVVELSKIMASKALYEQSLGG